MEDLEKARENGGNNDDTADKVGTRLRSGRVLGTREESVHRFKSAEEAKKALLNQNQNDRRKNVMSEENERLLLRGIEAVFERWTALTLAIQNEWGGQNSVLKARALVEETLEFLQKEKKNDSIEDFLFDCIAEDFNVQLEDESHEEVGKVLRQMREECAKGESFLVERVENQPLPREATQLRMAIAEADARNEGWKTGVDNDDEEMEDGESSGSSSGEDDGEGDDDGSVGDLAQGLQNMGGKNRKEKNKPDDDGWTVV